MCHFHNTDRHQDVMRDAVLVLECTMSLKLVYLFATSVISVEIVYDLEEAQKICCCFFFQVL